MSNEPAGGTVILVKRKAVGAFVMSLVFLGC